MYKYETEKPKLFTEEGQKCLFQVRDKVRTLLPLAGAVRFIEATNGCGNDDWVRMACLDRLVELREIREVTAGDVSGQHRVFVSAYS